MDFHSLSRKELQGLCKKNKIPANMTNLAMADALTALEKVEGLDDVLNLSTSKLQQSPPRTACRSSRRKPILAEPERSQTLTCTRRASRRTVADGADQETKNEFAEGGDQENVKANLINTPAFLSGKKTEVSFVEGLEEKIVGEKKNNLLQTPAVKGSSRRKKAEVSFVEGLEEAIVGKKKENLLQTPAVKGSSRRNAETKNAEKSVARVYSTRRSMRLLEQRMDELSLKEKEITAIPEADGCCKETEDVEEKKEDASGLDMTLMSVQSSGNNSDSEVCQNLAKSLDNASAKNPELVEVKVDANDCCSEELPGLEAREGYVISLSEEQVSVEVLIEQELLGEENKGNESESDDALEIALENGDHLAIVSAINEEDENVGVQVAQESTGKNPDATEIDGAERNLSEGESDDALGIASEKGDHLAIVSGINEEDENVGVQDVDQESTGKNPDASEIDGAERNLSEVNVLESENMEDAADNINESSDEIEPEVLCPEVKQVEEYDANETHLVECDGEEVLVDVSIVEDDNFVVQCLHETPGPAHQVSLSGDAEDQKLSYVHIDQAAELCAALVPASPMEKLPAAKYNSPYQPLTGGISKSPFAAGTAALVPASPMEKLPAAKYNSPYRPLVSGGGISKSPFAAGTIQGQFPRPAGSATRMSAVKNQIKTDMADAIDLVDKENIISLKMEEPKEEEKVKFNDMSLRQLKKMVKGMTIDKKKNAEEENNGIKVENKRVPLQASPDNY